MSFQKTEDYELEPYQMWVNTENGRIIANVLDIIDSEKFDKSFIFYTLEDDPEKLYASILKEDETSVEFETITDPEEIVFVQNEIQKAID